MKKLRQIILGASLLFGATSYAGNESNDHIARVVKLLERKLHVTVLSVSASPFWEGISKKYALKFRRKKSLCEITMTIDPTELKETYLFDMICNGKYLYPRYQFSTLDKDLISY